MAERVLGDGLGVHTAIDRTPWPERVLGLIVALVLFAIMALTFINVFLRYWFSSPITGSEEIVSFEMAVLIFSALPLVTKDERHISVGLLQGKLSARAAWLQRLFILAVSISGVAVMGWQLAEHGVDLAADQTTTTVLGLPLSPLSYFMSALSVATLFTLLSLLWRHLQAFRGTEPGARK